MTRALRPASLVGVLLAVFVVPMSVAGSAATLPSVAVSLPGDATALQWVVNSFNLVFAATTIGWGWLADRIGHRVVLRAGAALVVIGSVMSAAAGDLVVLDIARGIVGAGAAALLTASTGLIALSVQPARRNRDFALFGVVMGLGLALGPTLAGLVVDAAGWRTVFAAIGAVVLLGIVTAGRLPVSNRPTAGCRGGTARFLTDPRFIAICIVPVLHAVGFIATLTYLPLVLRAAWGLSAGGAGTAMLLMTAPALVASPVGSLLVRRRGWSFGRVVVVALCCLVVGDVLLLAAGAVSPLPMAVGMVLVGLAFGLPLGVLDGAALAAAPDGSSGRAAGVFNLVRLGAEALAVAAVGFALTTVLTASTGSTGARSALAGEAGTAEELIRAFATVQAGVVLVVSAGSVAVLTLIRRTARRASTGDADGDSDGVPAAPGERAAV